MFCELIDVLPNIFTHIHDQKTIRNVLIAHKVFRQVIEQKLKIKLILAQNSLFYLVLKYPNKEWHFTHLSTNKHIDMKLIGEYIDLPWNFEFLSFRESINFDIVSKYPDKGWSYKHLSTKNVNIQLVKKLVDKPWEMRDVSQHCMIDQDFIDCVRTLYQYEYLEDNHFSGKRLYWNFISTRADMYIIKNNFDLPWSTSIVRDRSDFDFDIIDKNPKKFDTYGYELSSHKNLSFEIVKKYEKVINWNWYSLSHKVNYDFVMNNIKLPWIWSIIDERFDIPFEFIYAHQDYFKYSWSHISQRKDITSEIIEKYIDMPWKWDILSTLHI